ncbi:hypothetical protein KCP75_24300 [Salmonella enterica subsp. enterica]|nr:hypothetical protein KCP75_24300 [Salmonella enterica subsp. enterica]
MPGYSMRIFCYTRAPEMVPCSSIGYSPRRMRRACSGNPGVRHVIGTRLARVADVSSAILPAMRTALCVAPGSNTVIPPRDVAINGQRVLQPKATYAADRCPVALTTSSLLNIRAAPKAVFALIIRYRCGHRLRPPDNGALLSESVLAIRPALHCARPQPTVAVL